jgi:hypothetical protein
MRVAVWIAALGLILAGRVSPADEGMWLFNAPPKKLLGERYGFDPTPAWLGHVQRASVRFSSGGSGSFVSADGLVMTNHHVGSDSLQKLSTAGHDYVKDGFWAKSPADELKCVDIELNVLMSIDDVTARVNAAVKSVADPVAASKARRAAMNTIEKESAEKTGLRSDVITLYQGGQYHLYRFKKYTDVRLVFAPEQAIAFFGGDSDNFEYPRYDLDVCFFRVYENGRPARIEHYLKWNPAGPADGELVFVSGHPGRTDRLNTVAHLQFLRDRAFPYALDKIRRREVMLRSYSERSLENARRAQDDLFMYQNGRKARLGGLAGLQDPAVMDRKRTEERALREAVARNPKLNASTGPAWDDVAACIRSLGEIYVRWDLLEQGAAFNSELFQTARGLLRMADEMAKPNADRLREYRESNLDSLKHVLFSTAPIYPDLETVKLADSLGAFVELAGSENPLVRKVLAGKSPRDRAAELVAGTQLIDVGVRRRLAAGGQKAIAASDDPMIRLARLVDGPARSVRRTYEERVEEPLRQAYSRIAQARFALYGTETYPDATFTLRLSFGVVRGYTELGQRMPPWTTLNGAFQHSAAHAGREPFRLPESWVKRKDRLTLSTPLNFVATPDIIGGNSGSPVVNRAGELVGIIFDGNLPSLVWDFAYSSEQGRAIAVHSAGILESLSKIYAAGPLVDELRTGKRSDAPRP